jgi:hypothetical protein
MILHQIPDPYDGISSHAFTTVVFWPGVGVVNNSADFCPADVVRLGQVEI